MRLEQDRERARNSSLSAGRWIICLRAAARVLEAFARVGADELRQPFFAWLEGVLPRRLPQGQLPDLSNFKEVEGMLGVNLAEWERERTQKLLDQGLEQGIEQQRVESLRELRQTLVRQTGIRFGELVASRLEPLLEPVPEKAELDRVADAFAGSESAEEFLGRVNGR